MCFYRNGIQCQKLQQVFEEQSFSLDTGPLLVYCRVDNAPFDIRPEIRCSGVSITTVAIATMQLVLNQFKNFLSHQLRME